MSATTIEIPLNVDLDNRPQTQMRSLTPINSVLDLVGATSVNTIADTGGIIVRPPITLVTTISARANGIFNPTPGITYVIEGPQVTSYSQSSSSAVGTVSNAGTYSFAASPLPNNLMFQNGSVGYAILAGVFSSITDANFLTIASAGIVPGIACLDGTYYVMDQNSAIWGSNLNDATVWPALNRINAWQDRSLPVALLQHRSYVVALKSTSMQVFYDAGNPIGSPLQPLLQAQQPVGCLEASTVQDIHGDTFWVASMKDEGVCVVQMNNLQIQMVSSPAVNRWLEAQYKIVGGIYNVSSPVIRAVSFSAFGHTFYALQVLTSLAPTAVAVYDVTTKKWSFWLSARSGLGNLTYSSYGIGFGSGAPVDTYFQGPNGYFRFNSLPGVNTPVSWRDQDSFGSGAYPVQITTPIIDGGTQAEKTAMRLEIFSDNQNNGAIEVAWSDNDYTTWSAFQTVALTETRAFLDDLGTFRRRAFRFKHSGPTPLRLQRAVLTVLVGSS